MFKSKKIWIIYIVFILSNTSCSFQANQALSDVRACNINIFQDVNFNIINYVIKGTLYFNKYSNIFKSELMAVSSRGPATEAGFWHKIKSYFTSIWRFIKGIFSNGDAGIKDIKNNNNNQIDDNRPKNEANSENIFPVEIDKLEDSLYTPEELEQLLTPEPEPPTEEPAITMSDDEPMPPPPPATDLDAIEDSVASEPPPPLELQPNIPVCERSEFIKNKFEQLFQKNCAEINAEDLSMIKSLVFSDFLIENLNKNDLDSVENIYAIVFKGNSIKSFPQDYFSQATRLKYISITNNYSFKYNLPKLLFNGLSDLIGLRISNTNLGDLTKGLFSNLKSLEILDLSGNRIREFDSELYSKAEHLTRIDLSNNQITNLSNENEDSGSLVNLEYISFRKNTLEKISVDFFKLLKNLKSMDLSNNRIHVIEPNTFVALSDISSINFQFNNISILNRGALRLNTKNNVSLNLSQNKITKIEDGAFSEGKFSLIDLSYNKLDSFSISLIQKVKIYDLNISSNIISDITNIDLLKKTIKNLYIYNNNLDYRNLLNVIYLSNQSAGVSLKISANNFCKIESNNDFCKNNLNKNIDFAKKNSNSSALIGKYGYNNMPRFKCYLGYYNDLISDYEITCVGI